MWPSFNVLHTVINKYSTFSDTATTTCKNANPHHRILQCKAIQHVGGRDIAFKWSSLLENLKSGVRDEGDTAQHSTWGSKRHSMCVYWCGWVGRWVCISFILLTHESNTSHTVTAILRGLMSAILLCSKILVCTELETARNGKLRVRP